MASIIKGYEYDIFISYRQKDNKYDGWVTEFVDNLKRELEATFKEEISVYFDINPHDGLLETHDVDESLKEKLKCLVFIPIISRTYCDPNSFAWEHEFKAFVELASQDQFGLKVRLLLGNVARRVLPVRIHDLENADLRLCEEILDGDLRSVDFIYKSAGVNRPLRANEDHPHDNLNKIYYRDQINKVANAIDEIISSLKRIQNISLKEDYLFKGSKDQNNIDFIYNNNGLKTPNTQLQLQTPGTNQNNSTGSIHKSSGYWFKNYHNYIFSILVIASLVFIVFNWKGQNNFFGIGKSKREQASSHVANAVAFCNNGELEAAKKEVALALENDPKNSAAWTTLAAVSVKEGDLNKAILQTLEAINFDPTNGIAAYNLAYALDEKLDYHQAIEWYLKAIKIDSALVPAYSALGRLYNNINQSLDAVLILKLAINKYPDSEYLYLIYKNLGNAYLLSNLPDEAIKYLEFSKGIKHDETETNLYLAKAYEAAGKITSSIELWQNYIELETDTVKIADAKKHLKEITIKHLQEIIK